MQEVEWMGRNGEGAQTDISWRGFFGGNTDHFACLCEWSISIFIETRFNIHTHPSIRRWRPGFARLKKGRENLARRCSTKEIEQGEIRARVFFARRTDATVH